MAITYTWAVLQMDAYPDQGGEQNVVFQVSYVVSGINENNISASIPGLVNVPLDPEAPFTPYDQLTQQQVIGWVQSVLTPAGVEATENTVALSIENQMNPPVVTPPLPWQQQSPEA